MSESALVRVERVCAELATTGHPITFTAVAEQAQISRATLYRDQQLRAVVDEHRTRQTDARTLTGLATEVAHLRTAVEALADRRQTARRTTAPTHRIHHPDDEPFRPTTQTHRPRLAGARTTCALERPRAVADRH